MHSRCVRYIKRAHFVHSISPIIHPPPRVLVHLYYVAIKGRLASRTLPAGCLFTFPRMDPCFLPWYTSRVRQGRGSTGRAGAARVPCRFRQWRRDRYQYTMLQGGILYVPIYLSPIQKKSDPHCFIMPIIFFRVICFGAFLAFWYELEKNLVIYIAWFICDNKINKH